MEACIRAIISVVTHPAPVIIAALILSACAGTPAAEDPDYRPGADYHLMMAEIALERGQYRTVVHEYVRAAELSEQPDIAIRATELAFSFGYDAAALRAAGRWLALEPEGGLVHLVLARLNLRRNDVSRATWHAERALGGQLSMPPRPEDYLLLAAELAQDAEPRQLTQLLARLAARDPLAGSLQLALANAALRSADYDLAIYAARSAALDDPDWPEPQLVIARARLGKGETAAALELSKSLLAGEPGPGLELEHARLLSLAGRSDEALQRLERLSAQHGTQPEIARLKAFIRLDRGESGAAWSLFNQRLAAGEDTDEALYYLGQIAAGGDSPEQAIRLYGQISRDPWLLPAQLAIAAIRFELDEQAGALEELATFTADYPQHAFAVARFRGALLAEAGDTQAALDAFAEALDFRPEAADLHLSRGIVLASAGQLNEALQALRRALVLAPDNALVQNALGYTLADANRNLREAERLIRLALEQEPANAAIIDSMGWLRFRQRRLDEALSWLEEAWSIQRDPEVAAHLGEVLWRRGERAAASELWADALVDFPDSAPLLDTIRRLQR